MITTTTTTMIRTTARGARRRRTTAVAAVVMALGLLAAACSSDTAGTGSASTAAPGSDGTTPAGAPASGDLPPEIAAIMNDPRYEEASWSLLVTDVDTGEDLYSLDPDELSLTGSTRKLFSVGLALDALGLDARQETPVHRTGEVGPDGTLAGDLVLVGGGDLTFGGRRIDDDTIEVTSFDHNDANQLSTAILNEQDPLDGVTSLAAQVKAAGITSVSGDIVVDDRLFDTYRVPNGNLLITPVILNENMVDTTITPTEAGSPATLTYRPATEALTVENQVTTGADGSAATVAVPGNGRVECVGSPGCSATLAGEIPADYSAPFTDAGTWVRTLRIEDPNAFVRTAFIEALERQGVTVGAPAVAPNPVAVLPPGTSYPDSTRVASFTSVPYAETARLILKVSLNLGANLSLSLFGLEKGQRTIDGALGAERTELVERFGLDGSQFDFPTNGSGTPDSQAAPRALVDFLTEMSATPVAGPFQQSLPILGVDGSLATAGKDLPGAGHVVAKTGTTVDSGEGDTILLTAQNLAGYIETRSGRKVAYALMVNDVGVLADFETDIGAVINDEALISSILYERL